MKTGAFLVIVEKNSSFAPLRLFHKSLLLLDLRQLALLLILTHNILKLLLNCT
jgi:hypothetical protein